MQQSSSWKTHAPELSDASEAKQPFQPVRKDIGVVVRVIMEELIIKSAILRLILPPYQSLHR